MRHECLSEAISLVTIYTIQSIRKFKFKQKCLKYFRKVSFVSTWTYSGAARFNKVVFPHELASEAIQKLQSFTKI